MLHVAIGFLTLRGSCTEAERCNPPQSDIVADAIADIVADTIADIVADAIADIVADTIADIVADAIADGRTLEYLKLEEIPWVIHGIDLSQGSHGLYMGLN